MTPLQLVTLALYVAAAGAGLVLARRDKRHRPVAWYLVVIVGIDVLRHGRAALLPPATAPRVGGELLLRHLEAGLYLAAILALPALAMALFLWRRPLGLPSWVWCAGLGLSLWGWVVGSYPELRGPELMHAYLAIELAGVLVSAGCLVTYLRSPELLRDGLTPPAASGLAILAGASVAVTLPRFAGGTLLEHWSAVVAINAAMIGYVLQLELRQLLGAPA